MCVKGCRWTLGSQSSRLCQLIYSPFITCSVKIELGPLSISPLARWCDIMLSVEGSRETLKVVFPFLEPMYSLEELLHCSAYNFSSQILLPLWLP